MYKGAADAAVLVETNESDQKMVPVLVRNDEAGSPGYTTGATILVSRRDLDPLEHAAMAKVSTKKPLVMWELFSGSGNVSRMFESYGFKAYCIDIDPKCA